MRIFFLFLFFIVTLHAENFPFGNKEKLVYKIKWGFISCGEATLEIEKISSTTYKIVSRAKSYPFFDHFYKVRNTVTSIWDIEKKRSLFYEKNLRQGKRKVSSQIRIDPQKNIATRKGKEWKVTENALDVLSALYYVRCQNLKASKEIMIDVYSKNKLWKLKVIVLGRNRIVLKNKKYIAFHVRPILRDEGVFQAKGEIDIWMTDDEKKIPVLMKSKVLIGSIVAELIKQK